MSKSKRSLFTLLGLLYLVAFSFFIWGVVVGNFKVFPWKQISAISGEIHEFLTFDTGIDQSTADKIILDALEAKTKYDFAGFRLRDSDFVDQGYLLISRYSKTNKISIVELFSIADEKVLHTWVPPFEEILSQSPKFQSGDLAYNNGHKNRSNKMERFRAFHPLLAKDGGLIFNSNNGPLVKIDPCGNINWVIDRQFHHSLEFDERGNIVVPIVIETDGFKPTENYRDDGVAIVSVEGEILEEYSVTEMLLDEGYRGLVLGVGRVLDDRIHLNDAQPISTTIGLAKTGDIALSIRHLSTVLLFRPQTKKIIWLKTGPWLNQHDINILDDGKFSVFGNDVFDLADGKAIFIEKLKSELYVYDPISDTVTQPYSDIMGQEAIWSKYAGRLRILSNNDAFVEQNSTSRLIRISKDKIRWEYTNAVSDNTVGRLNWSRYLANENVNLELMENLSCN